LDYVENAYGDAFFVNPALPEVRQYLLESYTYIAKNYDLDGFQLDYIRYPNKQDGEDFGYDDYTIGLYKEKYGKDPRNFTAGSDDYQSWCEFRASFVTQFVRDFKVKLNEIRPDMHLSAAVAPGYEQTLVNMCQDSVTWLEEGLIDIAHPMAYGTTDAVLRYIGETVRAASSSVFTCIGVSDQGGDIFREQILATRMDETDGVAFFSWNVYDARYSEIAKTIFASKAVSPTYNGKAALLAQLALIRDRIETQMQQDFPALADLCGDISEQMEALENSTLSARGTELRTLLNDIVSAASGTGNKAAEDVLEDDCRIAHKVLNSNRDDAKAAYIAEHPLPDSLIPEDESSTDSNTESIPSEGASAEESNASEPSDDNALNPVEKVFAVISMVILFGGLALVPVYIVLMIRRKKIIKSFDEQKDNDPQE
ncbi:MAG: family 10 glycosylhydrolase, partial [Clostridia bacterium]|nr:family 10 glycosylhydrolase [Clostridia bacterium]